MSDAFSEALAHAGGDKIRAAFTKYSRPGERHGGTVVSRDLFQSRDLDTGEPETWNDGKPVMKAKIVVQTEERAEPAADGTPDDGLRYLVIKWWGDDLRALKDAVGDRDLEIGGFFGAIFDREEAPKKPGFNGRKIYSYVYNAPAFMSAAPAEPPVQQAAPAPQPAPQPQQSGVDFAKLNAAQQAPASFSPVAASQGGSGFAPQQPAQPAAQAPVQNFPAPNPNAVQAAPQPAAQPAPQVSQVPAQKIQELIGQGFTDEDIMQATGASPTAVSTVRSLSQ